MLRLAIELGSQQNDFLTAATRIRNVEIVTKFEAADAIVTNWDNPIPGNTPLLLIGREPHSSETNAFPAFPWRFEPRVLTIRESLNAGNLGKPALMRLHIWSPPSQLPADGARIAAVDLALWFLGEQPDAVFSTSHAAGMEIIHLGFPGGRMALLDLFPALPDGESYRSLSLIGSRGAAYADDHRDRNLFFAGGPPGASMPDSARAFIRPMLEDFISNVLRGNGCTDAARDYQNAVNTARRARQTRI